MMNHNALLNTNDIVDGCLIVCGFTISIQDIQSILSIIILSLDVIWIIFKFVYKLIKHVKNGGDPSDMNDDYEDMKNDIKDKGGR